MILYSYASAQEVAAKIKAGTPDRDWAVVDVRDDDFIGGHLPRCHHIPFSVFSDKLPTLLQELKDVKEVVFHCAFSQNRGPSAARRYAKAREEGLKNGTLISSLLPPQADGCAVGAEAKAQAVRVLQRGFEGCI